MVDAASAQNVERLPDVLGRALLPRVRDGEESLGASAVEDVPPDEMAKRAAAMAGG